MEDLYDEESVIKLTDDDFNFDQGSGSPVLIHPEFRGKDGYVMAYAPWCPNCQNKVDFWSYLGREVNHNPQYQKENFRIGVINTTDPRSRQVLEDLRVEAIPHFFHVTPNSHLGGGQLSTYEGPHSPEDLLSAVCQQKKKLCQTKRMKAK